MSLGFFYASWNKTLMALFNEYYAFKKCLYFSKNELMLFIVSGVILYPYDDIS